MKSFIASMPERYFVLLLWSLMLLGFGVSSVLLPLILGIQVENPDDIKRSMESDPLPWMWMNNGVQLFAFFLPAAVMYRFSRNHELRTSFPFRTSMALSLLAVPAFGFMDVLGKLNHIVVSALPGLYESVLASEKQIESITLLMMSLHTENLFILVVTIAVVPALFEEFFFRGVLQRLFMKTKGPHAAIWLSAAAFSLIHFQFLGFIPRLVMGAMLGYITWLTGNWGYSAMVHFLNNLAGIVLMISFGNLDVPNDDAVLTFIFHTIAACVLCLWAFMMRRNYFRYFPSAS
jgi:membrane protease YdiL (CAAX protease family)